MKAKEIKKYPKLPKIFKAKWIAALRSKKYKQGKENLYNPDTDTYCCLEVACSILGIPNKILENKGMPFSINNPIADKKLIKFFKGEKNESRIVQDDLVDMNDTDGKSFIQISNWIEKNL